MAASDHAKTILKFSLAQTGASTDVAGIEVRLSFPPRAPSRRRGRRRALPFGSSCSAPRRRWRPRPFAQAGSGRSCPRFHARSVWNGNGGAEFGADQVFVSRHGRLSLVPPAVPGRLLPAHAAALGHEPDVAVTLALDAAVALAWAWHRRRPRRDDDVRWRMALTCRSGGVSGLAVIGAVRRNRRDDALSLPEQGRHLGKVGKGSVSVADGKPTEGVSSACPSVSTCAAISPVSASTAR